MISRSLSMVPLNEWLAASVELGEAIADRDPIEITKATLKWNAARQKYNAAKKVTEAAKITLDDCLATCHCGCGLGKECGKDGSCPGPNPPDDDDGISLGIHSGDCDSGDCDSGGYDCDSGDCD